MRRRQVIELEDLDACPRAVRDGGTDWLGFMANTTRAFDAVAPKILAAMEATGTDEVLDLCSGGGGPWRTLSSTLEARGKVRIQLTDRFPNLGAFEALARESEGRVGFVPTPIDATVVPVGERGVRTMFNAFHHFPPELARSILADAIAKRRAICIFEGVDQRLLPLLAMPLQAVIVLLLTPFMRPFKLSRFVLTYLLPAIPFVVMFDGAMSMLRIYLPDELEELVRSIPGHEGFDWDIGTTRIPGMPMGLTHLVGVPKV